MANSFKLLDLFSGIGGFHLGLEQAGFKFDWTGFSEIDKYANKQYKKRFPNARELGDVTAIQCEDLPKDIDILCGGFPCQTFSIAGKRKGFDDTRGTLFFEIARVLRHFRDVGKPIPYFILENVKGLLNHEDGRSFATIYGVLADLDYTIECELLNTRNFSCPQNRERIYIVGRFRGEPRRKIFPIGEDDKKVRKSRQVARCISSGYYKQGNQEFYLKQIGTIGEDSEATRVYDPNGCARTIKNGGGMGAKTGLYQVENLKIRRLTPTECERLQGFPDGWTEGQSDTQRYKQLGNAVSVPVVKAIAEKLISL